MGVNAITDITGVDLQVAFEWLDYTTENPEKEYPKMRCASKDEGKLLYVVNLKYGDKAVPFHVNYYYQNKQ